MAPENVRKPLSENWARSCTRVRKYLHAQCGTSTSTRLGRAGRSAVLDPMAFAPFRLDQAKAVGPLIERYT